MNYDLDTPEGMANAVAWQEQLVETLEEGGRWGVPRSGAVYTVYPSKKVAVRIVHEEEIDRVFNVMGWQVREEL